MGEKVSPTSRRVLEKHWFHGKGIPGIHIFFFHHADRQNKKQKFIKNQPFAPYDQIFLIFWKMRMGQGIIVFCQLIMIPIFLRQIFCCNFPAVQNLMHGLDHEFVRQTLCQTVYRIQGMKHSLIILSAKDFRLFHGEPPTLFHNDSTKNIKSP